MSKLCMWSLNLRHERHLIDGLLCFHYDLRIPKHGISKTSLVGYDMTSSKVIEYCPQFRRRVA